MRVAAWFVATVCGLALTHIALMVVIDPRGDFGTRLFPSVVYDARAQKLPLFQAFRGRGPVDGLVLGSSRAMKLRPTDLEARTGLRFFNFAVEGARPDDMLAIYAWVRHVGSRPKAVFLGLDVESLIVVDDLHWKLEQNGALLGARVEALGTAPSRWAGAWTEVGAYKRTFTFPYVRDASVALRVRLHPEANLLNAAFETDGYFRYRRWEMERPHGGSPLTATMTDCLTGHARNYEIAGPGLRPLHVRRLEELVRQMHADGAHVTVWLTGVHPETVAYLKQRTSYMTRLEETRALLASFRARYGIDVHDLADMRSYDGTATGWYDCGHVDEDNARLIAEALTRRRP